MKKQLVMMMAVLACGIAIAAPAVEPAPKEAEVKEFTTTIDVGYFSQYIWRGFDLMDDKAVVQPSVDFNWNGFGANVWSAQPTSGGDSSFSQVNATEFDYTVYYKNYLFEDDVCWRTDYKVGYRYYDFVKVDSETADMQEGFIELAWPNLIGNGFVPRYAYYHMWPGRGCSDPSYYNWGGPIHDLGFDYSWTFEGMPELPMKFTWDVVYNDGTGASYQDGKGTVGAEHDWSHMAYGISTAIKCPLTGGTITPGIWYQNSFESSVNNEDELWGGVSYTLSF